MVAAVEGERNNIGKGKLKVSSINSPSDRRTAAHHFHQWLSTLLLCTTNQFFTVHFESIQRTSRCTNESILLSLKVHAMVAGRSVWGVGRGKKESWCLLGGHRYDALHASTKDADLS